MTAPDHKPAARLAHVRPSMILGLVQKARQLASEGHPVIELGIGEPDFTTPDHIKQAAIEAIERDETRYTIVPGTVPMREAIAAKLKRENDLDCDLADITVGGGCKSIIFNAMMATVSPGDEVIIPAPYWSSYPDIVAMAEGVPVVVDCPQSQRFLISPAQLAKAITPHTRWLVLNSPSNPTGGVYSAEHLERLAKVLRAHPHVAILSDDIYEHLMFNGHRFASILNVAPDLKDRVLIVNGVSKVFAMTGWRLGYAAGPSQIIKQMNVVQGQSLTHACSISQAAGIAALSGPTGFLATRSASFQKRRDIVVDALNVAQGISCIRPEGAFYVYPDCSGVIGKMTPAGRVITSDIEFCTHLLEDHYVSAVPGAAFGLSPHLRISTAASEENLREACARIAAACADLKEAS
ncbi:pyridoxal phosphate-dependent aminotransferase [uncultured Ruegeria sp.]|uniref:pyridoxal phosphate-dependent aminotransferase n=1 Tax=uncultured Ruegeria sp. TaxID=259304 RepID=UPI002638E99A|nr:pyridoxal phosphate-dependent aminotransferase [uncultured Ruegeria sp.]